MTHSPFRGRPIADLNDVAALEADVPDLSRLIGSTYSLLRQGAAIEPGAPALSFFLRSQDFRDPFVWSHQEWFERITQTGNMFRRLGVERDDVVAFILPNLPETHWTIWGGESAGIVFAINPLLEPAMMLELMRAAQPKWLVTLAPTPGADLWQKVSSVAQDVPSLKGVLTVSPMTYLRGMAGPVLKLVGSLKTPAKVGRVPVLDFHDQLKGVPSDRLEFQEPSGTDVASYFCTGGTTGLPKIAVRFHATEVANALELRAAFGEETFGPHQSAFCGLPLFHVNAQIGTGLTPWSMGAHIVLGTPQGYRGEGVLPHFWEIIAHYKAGVFSGVPTVYSALLQVPRTGHDLSHLRYGICGAAPMPVELFSRFERETGIKILEGYGLTEGGCVSSINPPGGESKVGSIGMRLPWQDMRTIILSESGHFLRDAEVDEAGAIIIKGPNLFKGYLNPDHNKGLWIDRPGAGGVTERWLNTGDLGRMDKDGYFWLTGRNKELIIRGGHNIDPKMIEEPMHLHPAVALAAAVGRPDAHAGEVPVVYVQLRPNAQTVPAELMAHACETIAERAAWPKKIVTVDVLPTTAIGKIYKPALVQQEIESVFKEEAAQCGVSVKECRAEQDPRLGTVLRWRAEGDLDALRARLGGYAFKHQEI